VHRPGLSTQILLLQLTIIVVTIGVGAAVAVVEARRELDKSASRRSLVIARTVAAIPELPRALRLRHPERVIDPIAERIRRVTDASFVVVTDRAGIRYSHPDKSKIGKSLAHDPGEPIGPILAGHEFVGAQKGSLGRSARAKVPLRDARGRIVGMVSVGVLERNISDELVSLLPVLLIPTGIALLLGLAGSALVARRVKRQTFGLEPNEIAALFEQREALLHGIREGTVATDGDGRVTLANDEAKRLLGLDEDIVGKQLVEAVPIGHVRDVLDGHVDGSDNVVLVDDRVLVVNRMPVEVRGRSIGAVITLRDRTELEKLLRELNDVRSLADALRAQEHEFTHRLHVIAGLIELGRHADAADYIQQSSHIHQALVASIVDSVGEPTLLALLLGKAAVASERGIELQIGTDSSLSEDYPDARDLVTVVGNLVDNALDSLSSHGGGGAVEVTVRDDPDGVLVRVRDTGPGVDPASLDVIFRDGFTTKAATGTGRRGLGLALVSQTVKRRDGGWIRVENDGGAVFTAFLPHRAVTEARA
jgi:two-component system CitB family sensor kinase